MAFKDYFDKTFITGNPAFLCLKWFKDKAKYQIKYWGNHLRIQNNSYISDSKFGKYNRVGAYNQISNSNINDFTYFADFCLVNNATIGKFCSVGPRVTIAPGKHPTSVFVSTHPSIFNNQLLFKKNFFDRNNYNASEAVTIGNDVWIGANSIILDGVTIGDGAIIAANSVVTKDIKDYEIVGGTPTKLIKMRFSDAQIKKLKEIQWWDKPESWIKENRDYFLDVNVFVDNINV